jgi:hypothetical protein
MIQQQQIAVVSGSSMHVCMYMPHWPSISCACMPVSDLCTTTQQPPAAQFAVPSLTTFLLVTPPQVESWTMEQGREWVGDSWDELKYIRQAVTFLVIGNKPKKSLDDITRDLCPILSIQQLYRISTMYWDEKYNTETVSSEVSPLTFLLGCSSSRVPADTAAIDQSCWCAVQTGMEAAGLLLVTLASWHGTS